MLCGLVILYNPDTSLKRNILSYIDHLDLLFVIDNSPNSSWLDTDYFVDRDKIVYLKNDENIGVARALNLGCRLALEKGFKWILTMDQDSSFLNANFFQEALDLINLSDVGIISASYNKDYFEPKQSINENFVQVGIVITSGNLVNLEIWNDLGGFNEIFFIDEVDNEYCIRLKRNGKKIFVSKEIYLNHCLGEPFLIKNRFTKKINSISRHSPLRMYYIFRNNLFLWTHYIFIYPSFIFNRIKKILTIIWNILFFYPNKKEYFIYIIRGITDFFHSRFGIYKN